MRFVRMLTNAMLAGWLSAAYLTVLLLQLNPDVPVLSATTGRWFLTFAATYGLLLAIAFYTLLVVREFFSLDALSPGWASVRVLSSLAAVCAAGASVLMWVNASAFRLALGEVVVRRMTGGALATTASAAALIGIAVLHFSYGRRGGRTAATCFVAAVAASVALPLTARGPAVALPQGPEPLSPEMAPPAAEGPRLTLLLLDGASLEYIRARVADGRLPHFSRLLDAGASMYLATIRPTQPAPVWAATATGMYPAKNGVRSAARYYARGDTRPIHLLPEHCFAHGLVRVGAIRNVLHTSESWGARPFWEIVSRAGIASGIVGWPLTYPARPVRGFMLTDRFHAHDPPVEPGVVYPSGLFDAPAAPGGARPAGAQADPDPPAFPGTVAWRDRVYRRAAESLRDERLVRVLASRAEAIDAAGHRHVDDGGTAGSRDDGDDPASRTGAQQLERAYADVDAQIGAIVDALAPGDLLLVVSAFGMQRLHPVKALAARLLGDSAVGGTHERAPDGFLIVYGTAVHPGRLPRGSIVDVAPTVLYFLGLPIGRDMDGFARTDLFTSDFTAERPIAFIGTHN